MTKSPKLTDLDLVLLSAAAQRADGMVLPPPETVRARGKTLEKALAKLLRLALVEECPAAIPDQAWRQDDDARGIALRIAPAGRAALGLDPEPEHQRDDPAGAHAAAAQAASPGVAAIKPGTKQARLVECLSRPCGASLDDLVHALGWQVHTVRAALTGLRKKGYAVTRDRDARGVTVYRASRQAIGAGDAA